MAGYSQAVANGDRDPDPLYGPPEGFYAAGHDPVLLIRNLSHTRLFESTGTGTPSQADPDPAPFDVTEEHIIYPMNENYHRALTAAGLDCHLPGPLRRPRYSRLPQ